MLSIATINYAAPPIDYFWSWSPTHDAAEWYSGPTLTMWQELQGLLAFLNERGAGLPPLGSILLVLAACRDEWLPLCIQSVGRISEILEVDSFESISRDIRDTFALELKIINDLPKELRSSFPARCHLLTVLFEGSPHNLRTHHSNLILQELARKGPQQLKGYVTDTAAKTRFSRDLWAIKLGLARHDGANLEARLRTSLNEPSLQPPSLPEVALEPESFSDLLEHLAAAGGEKQAAATVAKRTIALISIPGNVSVVQTLPVGGISDITNRGTIDRLLPGELAWDDLILAARLVHNEALYFRREIPPMNVAVQHTILLDRGLRLWGAARVLSLGMALGLYHHPAVGGQRQRCQCIAALQNGFTIIDLASPQGVSSALETLVPCPSPDSFLSDWWESVKTEECESLQEVSFITAIEHLKENSTCLLLGEIASWLNRSGGSLRVISVSRTGEIEIHGWATSGNRCLAKGEIDICEILRPARKIEATPPENSLVPLQLSENHQGLKKILPIYREKRLPFLFPELPGYGSLLLNDDFSCATGISQNNRLMYWAKSGWGAQELIHTIPGINHSLNRDESKNIIIVSKGKAGEPVRVFRVKDDVLDEIEVVASLHSFPRNTWVSGGTVLLGYSDCVEAISLTTGHRVAVLKVENWPQNSVVHYDGENINLTVSPQSPQPALNLWHRTMDAPLELIVPEKVEITSGKLSVAQGAEIFQFNTQYLRWDQTPLTKELPYQFEQTQLRPTPEITLTMATVGSKHQIYHDPRGMLHVVNPSDSSVWSILLLKSSTSAWHPSWGLCSFDEKLRLPKAESVGGLAIKALSNHFAANSKPRYTP